MTRLFAIAFGLALAAAPSAWSGNIVDPTPANVTTRGFSLVWAFDEAIANATIRVYADPSGADEITSDLNIVDATAGSAAVRANGLGMIDARGLAPDTTVYVQLESVGATGSDFWPSAPPYFAVRTAVRVTRGIGEPVGAAIANDLVQHVFLDADAATLVPDAVALLDVVDSSAYPLAELSAAGGGQLRFDTTNLYDAAGVSLNLEQQSPVRITELLGLRCAGLVDHRRVRERRMRVQGEVPPVSSLQTPDLCAVGDTVCDGVIDVLDLQFVLDRDGAASGDCAYLSELDTDGDADIDPQDTDPIVQSYGQQVAP